MKYPLTSIRVHISFNEEQIRFLQENSDLPFSEDCIFAKLFPDQASLFPFLESLKRVFFLQDETIHTITEEAGNGFLQGKRVILMFSDERSGSSQLEVESITELQNIVTVSIRRIRGLTMDMAWQFLLTSYAGGTATKAAAKIHTVSSVF